jgi:hypothetical protein
MRTIGALLGFLSLLASAVTQGTAFTYQGYLRQGGTPANANHDFQFSLWTTVSGGSQVGATQTLTNVPVQNGLFTVSLDFGTVWDGSAWAPAADIGLTLPFSGGASVSGATFQVANTAASGATYGGWFESTGTSGVGVYGRVAATTGTTYGVYGESRSTSGRGVYGWAAATTGTTYGVYGESRSTSGRGVFGLATATNGTTFGVYGQSSSPDGRGVYGWAIATTGTTYGVYGQSESTQGFGGYFVGKGADAVYVQNTGSGRGLRVVASLDTALWAQTATGFAGVDGRNARSNGGIGVFGHATATATTETYGVYGRSDSLLGIGVFGLASATDAENYGVYGQSEGIYGRGVYGEATATAGRAIGVVGTSESYQGCGVYGRAYSTDGGAQGVYGRSDSTQGYGVYAIATATSGTAYGVYGRSDSDTGHGVFASGRFSATGKCLCVGFSTCPPPNLPRGRGRSRDSLPARGEGWGGGCV